jgi:periplasmic divalent cation tolerance protein
LADAAILVLTQMPDRASAQRLARTLVEERLAACVSIGAPAESLYHWKGAIETAEEYPVTIKTRAARYPDVEAQILALHPYELPEVIAVPLSHGLARYLDWIAAETTRR